MFNRGRGTVRRRFTALYAGVFAASAAAVLAMTYLLVAGTSRTDVDRAGRPGETGPDASSALVQSLQDQLARANAQHSRQLLIVSLVVLALMVAVSVLVGRALAGRVLRPLRQITEATRQITADDLGRRLAVPGPDDEVKDLADTIDGLLQRLEVSFEAQRRFAANASHELRTPLTTMRASLDVAAAKPLPAPETVALADRLRVQLDHVDDLLDGLLALARAQHGGPPEPVAVDVGELVVHAVHARAIDIASRTLDVQMILEPDTRVHGNPALLSRMIDNVLDNAIAHNERSGSIRVELSRRVDEARLVIENVGPVLDQNDVDQLARPFRRLGADRIGSPHGCGLGLSIVAAIAAAHRGRLELRARTGGGLAVAIDLPEAPRPVGALASVTP